MPYARVVATHRAPVGANIRIESGEAVTLGARDDEWPEFVWTQVATGLGGWIPATLFDQPSGAAIAQADYDTRELAVEIGERVIVHRELAGWWWAENDKGASGWIPDRVIRQFREE